ncbi:CGNR zinc finger domain-containing protein [Paenibacillus tarimensis]|uniref:CGNR zinc finger domain-containing protein n=1 Tax=Paenibacillus tarimensis TaxID=416012 RepID=UPI001F21887A|nr:CGNR zinc finger domain-containing protein [Paenibacillus tarimensis]MCF2943011.1 CGNR zinc finger domain-containing protein [Paenibacillus tarimensis]
MPKKIPPSFYFIGNHPALDFINTKIAADGKPLDLLGSYNDVLEWLVLVNFFTPEQIEAAGQKWGQEKCESLVAGAVALRSSMLTMVQKGMKNEDIVKEDIESVNSILKEQVITTRLLRDGRTFTAARETAIRQPVDLLIPVAEAAVDLFTHYDPGLVKKCENPDCVLYFYDNSKNSTRRWCSQKTCGNRMKVAAYHERRKNSGSEES